MYVGGIGVARASVLDVTDPTFYEMYLYTQPANNTQVNGRFDATVGGCGIKGASDNNLQSMNTFSQHSVINYNMTFNDSSAILFNGGLGKFTFGGEDCTEWAVPAGITTGTLNVRGQDLTIKPEESFTWYDRQFGDGGLTNGNYTWFQIHLPNSSIRASIWAIDNNANNITTPSRIATFRYPDGSHTVSAFDFLPNMDAPYVSSNTGVTYPTSWILDFPGQGNITIKSIRADQETFNVTSGGPAAYEGFSDVDFNLFGISEKGFGLAEMVDGNKSS